MTDLTEQEVCIGSLGQQKVYLYWSDVKDICTYAVSAAYEQTKRENAQLKELLARAKGILTVYRISGNQSTYSQQEIHDTITKIDEALQ